MVLHRVEMQQQDPFPEVAGRLKLPRENREAHWVEDLSVETRDQHQMVD